MGWQACAFASDGAASPLFPPAELDADHAATRLLHQVRRDPHLDGFDRSRWRLADLLKATHDWIRLGSLSGMWRLLHRLHVHYKRARLYVHSADPHYQAKLARIETTRRHVQKHRREEAFLYEDEMGYYQQPSLAQAYDEAGRTREKGPKAQMGSISNRLTRIVGTLDAFTGRVVFRQATKIGVSALVKFYEQLVAAYPDATRIWIVQDNSFVHFHPDLMVALEPQENPFPIHLPKTWPTEPSARAQKKWRDRKLPIQLVTLPTSASWCNPIEKLWRKAKQDKLHLHRKGNALKELRQEMIDFFEQFANGSADLLRYTGLHPPY
jgi:hypothetical protein